MALCFACIRLITAQHVGATERQVAAPRVLHCFASDYTLNGDVDMRPVWAV